MPKAYRKAVLADRGATVPVAAPPPVQLRKSKKLAKGSAIIKAAGPLQLIKSAPGVRIVSGIVADESLDDDGQRAEYGWASKALRSWFNSGANLRRDHDVK